MVQRGIVCALVNMLVAGKVTTVAVADEICRTFTMLSFTSSYHMPMVSSGHILIGLHILWTRNLCSKTAIDLLTVVLCNLSYTPEVRPELVRQDGFKLMIKLLGAEGLSRLRISCYAKFIHHLCLNTNLHHALMDQHVMSILLTLIRAVKRAEDIDLKLKRAPSIMSMIKEHESFDCPDIFEQRDDIDYDEGQKDPAKWSERFRIHQDILYNLAMSIQLLSLSDGIRERIIDERAVFIMAVIMRDFVGDNTQYEIAYAIGNLAHSPRCKRRLVEDGAIELLITLCKSEIKETQERCAGALGLLSDATTVGDGTVGALIMLSLKDEGTLKGDDIERGANNKLKFRGKGDISRDSYAQDVGESRNPAEFLEKMKMKSQHLRSSQFHSSSSFDGFSVEDQKRLFDVYFKNRDKEMLDISRGGAVGLDYLFAVREIMLSKKYNNFLYSNVLAKNAAEPGGMTKRASIDLPFPGISDTVSIPPDRIEELNSVAVISVSLTKEFGVMTIPDAVGDDVLKHQLGSNKTATVIRSKSPLR